MRPRSALALAALALVAWGAWFFWLRTAPGSEEQRRQSRRLLPGLDDKAVERITIERPSEVLVLTRSGDDWRLESPVEDLADRSAIESLLGDLAGAEVGGRVAPGELAGGLAAAGLADGAIKIALDGVGPARRAVVGSTDVPGGKRYTQVEGAADLALVDRALVDVLSRPLDDFRRHDLFTASPSDIHRWQVLSAGKPLVVFERRSGDRWWIESPLTDLADGAAVSGVLSRVVSLRADRFVEASRGDGELGLMPPHWTVELFDANGGAVGALRLGAETPAGQGKRYGAVAGRAARFEVYAADLLGELSREPRDLRSKLALDFAPYDVDEVEITCAAQTVRIRRGVDGSGGRGKTAWVVDSPENFPLVPQKLDDLLARLSRLEVLRLDDAVSPASAGLTTPAARFTIRGADDRRLPPTVLEIGGPAGAGEVFARGDDRRTILVLEEKTVRDIDPATIRR